MDLLAASPFVPLLILNVWMLYHSCGDEEGGRLFGGSLRRAQSTSTCLDLASIDFQNLPMILQIHFRIRKELIFCVIWTAN